MSILTLQWAVGAFSALIGALMLVAPHQFGAPAYAELQGHLPWWGAAFLAGGGALAGAATFPARRWLGYASHALTGAALLMLAGGTAAAGEWNGVAVYAVLGIGTVLAPLLRRPPASRRVSPGDLFALLVGVAAALTGGLMLALPGEFTAPVYDRIRPALSWYGTAFLGGGLGVALAQMFSGLPRPTRAAVHLLLAGTFFAFLFAAALPGRAWTDIAFYAGFGAVIAALPWAGGPAGAADGGSLRARLTLLTAAAAALPVIAAVTLIADRDERAATVQALALQQTVAIGVAEQIANHVNVHSTAVTALALHPGLPYLFPAEQQILLRRFAQAYRDVASVGTFDAAGAPIARGDGAPPEPARDRAVFDAVRRSNRIALVSRASARGPELAIGAPIEDPAGRFAGMVMAVLEPARLNTITSNASAGGGTQVYVVDRAGRVLARSGASPGTPSADVSHAPPVAALLGGRPAGSLAYGPREGRWLAGYAVVPAVGWGVVVERPATAALAGIRETRTLNFGILVLVVGVAAALGLAVVRGLTAPLSAIAATAAEITRGDRPVVRRVRGSAEIEHLAAAMRAMSVAVADREDALRRAVRVRERLYRLTDAAGRAETMDEIFAEALESLGEALGADRAALHLAGRDGELHAAAQRGLPETYRQTVEGLTPWAPGATEFGPVLVPDVARDPGIGPPRAALLAEGVRAAAVVPLVGKGRLLGALAVYDDAPRLWSSDEVRAAQTIASHVAHAIERRRADEALQQSEELFRQLAENVEEVFYVADPRARHLLYVSPAYETIWGRRRAPSGVELREMLDAIHPADRGRVAGALERQRRGSTTVEEYRVVRPDGSIRWILDRAFPLADASGQVYRITGIAEDITDRRLVEDEVRRSRDQREAILQGVADGIAVQDAAGGLLYANEAAARLMGYASAADLLRAPPGETPRPFELVNEAGRRITMDDLPGRRALRGERAPEMLVRWRIAATDEERWSMVRATPIVDQRGQTRMVVNIFHDLTERKRAEDAQRFLAEASAVLAGSLDHETTLGNLARLAVPRLADWCVVHLWQDDALRLLAVAHRDPAREAVIREFDRQHPLDRYAPGLREVARSGRSALIAEVTDADLAVAVRDGGRLERLRGLGLRSVMIAPLVARDRTLGTVTFVAAERGRRYRPADLALAEDLARRAALAVDNARLYEHEREVAATLQRSLLPERLPEIPGLRLAARYLAGGTGVEVGGDFYDVLPLPGGQVGLVMGDVVGRGIPAAAAVGLVRNALRAYALEGHGPAEVADRLNRLLRGHEREQMVTLLYLVFDPETWRVRFASAGHPAPLVVPPGGPPAYLTGGRGLPLGVFAETPYHEAEAVLAPGSTVLLFTDGLVESRATPIDQGLAHLRDAAADAPPDPDELCDHVLAAILQGRAGEDDVALLALHGAAMRAERLHIHLPATPTSLAPLRHALRRWLAESGAEPDEVYEITVAVGEAAANALEHAYGPGDAAFEVEAAEDGGNISVMVRDFGRWREARGTLRGRGLVLMDALMESVRIERTPQGTTVHLGRRLRRKVPA